MSEICVGTDSRPLRVALISVVVRPLGESEPKRSFAVTRSELIDEVWILLQDELITLTSFKWAYMSFT
jgi:hypothetical protein